MAKKKPRRRPRWLGINSDGRDGSWSTPTRKRRKPKPFSLAGAVTRIMTIFRMDGKRRVWTERRRGRKAMNRLHPNRYRRAQPKR